MGSAKTEPSRVVLILYIIMVRKLKNVHGTDGKDRVKKNQI